MSRLRLSLSYSKVGSRSSLAVDDHSTLPTLKEKSIHHNTAFVGRRKRIVAIIGASGQTGRWALKGALVRGFNVRVLVRDKAKAEKIFFEVLSNAWSRYYCSVGFLI